MQSLGNLSMEATRIPVVGNARISPSQQVRESNESGENQPSSDLFFTVFPASEENRMQTDTAKIIDKLAASAAERRDDSRFHPLDAAAYLWVGDTVRYTINVIDKSSTCLLYTSDAADE